MGHELCFRGVRQRTDGYGNRSACPLHATCPPPQPNAKNVAPVPRLPPAVRAAVKRVIFSAIVAGIIKRRFKSEVQQGSIDGMAE